MCIYLPPATCSHFDVGYGITQIASELRREKDGRGRETGKGETKRRNIEARDSSRGNPTFYTLRQEYRPEAPVRGLEDAGLHSGVMHSQF